MITANWIRFIYIIFVRRGELSYNDPRADLGAKWYDIYYAMSFIANFDLENLSPPILYSLYRCDDKVWTSVFFIVFMLVEFYQIIRRTWWIIKSMPWIRNKIITFYARDKTVVTKCKIIISKKKKKRLYLFTIG